MARVTLTIDTADYHDPQHAARLLEELLIAARENEGITVKTASARFTAAVAEVHDPEPAAPEVIAMLVEAPDEEIQVTYTTTDVFGHKVERTAFYADGETVLVCPHPDCGSQEFYEADRAERWNEMSLADAEGEPYMHVSQGSPTFETTGFLCQSCQRPVTMPAWIEFSWS